MSKISIIIPCYNVEKHIERCVESLFNQTIGIENLQLIFIDDASTDNTLNMLYEIEKEYPDNIIIISCEKNGRQGTARNIGIQYAQADYIGFVDSDDWIDETMYEKLYQAVIQYDCDMVCCNLQIIYEDNSMNKIYNDENKLINIDNINKRKEYVHKGVGNGGIVTKIYRKKLIIDNNLFFPTNLTYEDNYWSFIISFYFNKVYYLHEYLYYYCFNPNSTIVTKNSKHHFDRLKIELMKIEYLKNNELFEIYHDEIEFNFINSFYINSLYVFFVRLDDIPLDMICKMNEILLKMFPSYKNNKYFNEIPEDRKVLFSLLTMNRKELIDRLPYFKSLCL